MYSGENRYMIVSIMNINAIPAIMTTMQKYPEDFVYFTDEVRVQGDFHFNENEIGHWISAYKYQKIGCPVGHPYFIST